MRFEKLRKFSTLVIDDHVLNIAKVSFKATPEYQKLLVSSTQNALGSAIRWLWLVGLTCSGYIFLHNQIRYYSELHQSTRNPFGTSIDYAIGAFLVFLFVCALFSRLRLSHQLISTLSIKTLAWGFALIGCYWAVILTLLEGNQQLLFSVSLYFILIYSAMAGLYVSTLCLYSFVLPLTVIPQVIQFLFFSSFQIFVMLGIVIALCLMETGRRMLSHWFNQATRQEYTSLTYAAKLDKIAHIDPLTHIPNRRQFANRLNKLISLAPLSNTPPTVILIDVDYFKKYNDCYGHLMGDECLINIAQSLTHSVRDGSRDLVARYGGEEFVVVLSDITPALALEIAQRIHNEINKQVIPHAASDIADHVTVSQGVAQWQEGESAKHLLSRADEALYRSKGLGRNRFSIAE